jgi:CheY-like chemotaxis protein
VPRLPTVRVLVVDDYEPFRRFVCLTLERILGLRVIGEASDGLEAVHKTEELQPDLIVLDIGLPTVTGIEAARRIRTLCPDCKILFLSQESSSDVVQAALSLGALGYVVKTAAGTELCAAVEEVCQGRQFVSGGISSHSFPCATAMQPPELCSLEALPSLVPKNPKIGNHEVQFYSDEAMWLVGLTRVIEDALKMGDMVIVVATEPHRNGLLQRLQAHGVDVATAIERRRYIPLDAVETLSTFMESAGPNRKRFLSTIGPLIRSAETAAEVMGKKVIVFGEMVAVLCAECRMEAAFELERLWNELGETHLFYLRCAYPMTEELQGKPRATICAEHSAVLPAET